MRENLVSSRQISGLTQLEVADRLQITERHYQSLEAGTSYGSVKVWQALSQLFGKTIDYLLEDN